jgi:hypothetical protein
MHIAPPSCEVCGRDRELDRCACTNCRCGACCRTFCTPEGGPTGGHNRRFVGPVQLRFLKEATP